MKVVRTIDSAISISIMEDHLSFRGSFRCIKKMPVYSTVVPDASSKVMWDDASAKSSR